LQHIAEEVPDLAQELPLDHVLAGRDHRKPDAFLVGREPPPIPDDLRLGVLDGRSCEEAQLLEDVDDAVIHELVVAVPDLADLRRDLGDAQLVAEAFLGPQPPRGAGARGVRWRFAPILGKGHDTHAEGSRHAHGHRLGRFVADQTTDHVGVHEFSELAAVAVDDVLAAGGGLEHHVGNLGIRGGKLLPVHEALDVCGHRDDDRAGHVGRIRLPEQPHGRLDAGVLRTMLAAEDGNPLAGPGAMDHADGHAALALFRGGPRQEIGFFQTVGHGSVAADAAVRRGS
jgi:hypothetical protein